MGKERTGVTAIQRTASPPSDGDGPSLVVIHGLHLGKKHELSQDPVILGRSRKADIRLDQDGVSRHHAEIYRSDSANWVRDLDSTNGTFVNGHPVEECELRDGDQLRVGDTILKFLTGANVEARFHDKVYRLTTTDGLTQVLNKRFFLSEMSREMSRALRHRRDLSLVMLDIDHFKTVNDTYGHLAGDHVLKGCAQRISASVRRDDVLGRYGGEEFGLLLPEIAKERAVESAQRIRRVVQGTPFQFEEEEIAVTVSLGVADLREYVKSVRRESPAGERPEVAPLAFIGLADRRLNRAKAGGRNRVVWE